MISRMIPFIYCIVELHPREGQYEFIHTASGRRERLLVAGTAIGKTKLIFDFFQKGLEFSWE